jgi:hypothetical protein
MTQPVAVYLEVAPKRTFASAIDWPGWSRGGRDEAAALAAFVAAGPRYLTAMGALAAGLVPPADADAISVVARLPGGSGTEFGVPSRPAPDDDRPVGAAELEILSAVLRAAWSAFDRAAAAAVSVELATGPRGGGRRLAKIVDHVHEADWAYLGEIGGKFRPPAEADAAAATALLRETLVETLGARVRGEPAPPSRRTKPLWSPRYLVRRSAWHALDHAWEIEDRAIR